MDPRLFLGTAHFLRNNGTDEAAYRSAISRAYYACFLEVRRIAFKNCDRKALNVYGIYKERDMGHKDLLAFLKNSVKESIRMLGNDLDGLQRSRQDADYEMSSEVTADDAEYEIDESGSILEDIPQQHMEIGRAVEDYISRIHQARKR